MLLHQLGTSDGCTVVFDSTQTLDGEPETAPVSEEQDDDRMIELSFIDGTCTLPRDGFICIGSLLWIRNANRIAWV